MEHFGWINIVGLVAVVVAVHAVARRYGMLEPIVLVLVGIVLSFPQGVLEFKLTPEVVLIGILPPLLYVAAVETSVPAFRVNLRPILLLAVGLTLVTAFAVGFVVHALVPAVPLAAALALGAVVAPPDAVAATAIARRVGLPRRVVTILEGESLLNDATALVTLRVAVAIVAGEALGAGEIAWKAVVASVGGVAVGLIVAIAMAYAHKKVTDTLTDNALSVLTPFLAFAPAELIDASGVVAVVVCGLYLGHRYPVLMSAASRLQTDAFWRMVKFLLEGVLFLLVGLQLRDILRDLGKPPGAVVGVTIAVVATVILVRFAWVYPATYLARLVPAVRRRDPVTPARAPAVIGWAGMRGAVTLAAAFSLPATLAGGAAYPRGLLLWLAFAVIVCTLVLQGMTLPWVARRLKLPADDPKEDALAEAVVQSQASKAGLDRLYELGNTAPASVVEMLRKKVEGRSNAAWERLGSSEEETPSEASRRLRREMLNAEREVFRVARDEGKIPEEVLRSAQRQLDLEESLIARED